MSESHSSVHWTGSTLTTWLRLTSTRLRVSEQIRHTKYEAWTRETREVTEFPYTGKVRSKWVTLSTLISISIKILCITTPKLDCLTDVWYNNLLFHQDTHPHLPSVVLSYCSHPEYRSRLPVNLRTLEQVLPVSD